MLPHDSEGFLIGETITDIKRTRRIMDQIKSDIGAIKAAVVSPRNRSSSIPIKSNIINQNKSVSRDNRHTGAVVLPGNQSSTAPKNRDARGRFISSSVTDIVEPGQGANRNKKGRFTSSTSTGKDERNTTRLFGNFADRIAKSFAEAETGLADVDPNVKAAQEIAQPLSKGYQAIFGGESDKKKFHWFSRIFRELKLSREESTVHAKAQKKVLDDIEEKTGGSAAGGGGSFFPTFGGSFLGSSFTKIIRPVLGTIFSPIGLAIAAGATAAWGLFTETGKKFFSDLGNKIAGYAKEAWQAFKDFLPKSISDSIDKVTGWVGDAGQKAMDTLEGIKKDSPKTMEFLDKAQKWLGGKVDQFKKSSPKTFGTDKQNKKIMLNELDKQGIHGTERAMLMAQLDHETQGFTRTEENLNYSARRLRQVSKKARSMSSQELNDAVARGDEGVAEVLYGGRKDLGNTQPGDGYKYRGRGFVQLTGRSNYERIGKLINQDLVNNPDLAAVPEIAAKAAFAYYKTNPKLQKASKSGDVVAARRALNGGLNGIDDVRRLNDYYSTIQNSAIPEVKVPSMPALPVIQDSPGVLHPSKSKDDRQPFVSLPIDVGQDLSDRKIGLIATGGLNL
ncbi:glycoside hydrolase family 19 protein [Methylotuvimicrobium sp. KM2]|uniref:glycoside hydrolase family 19 protein n=1 Tax=Methylotuvimicrobium sp. KM2 TaxID=3133976 RepID=UPI00310174C1